LSQVKKKYWYFHSSLFFCYFKFFKVLTQLEMSDFSSRILVNENSGCESDENSDTESKKIDKFKSRKRVKKDPVTKQSADTMRQHPQVSQSSDDEETESQQNMGYEESPVDSSTPMASPVSSYNQEKMRRRLQFFFMNPIEKWQAKRR
jgi:mucolipin